jgi:hypothetical protein
LGEIGTCQTRVKGESVLLPSQAAYLGRRFFEYYNLSYVSHLSHFCSTYCEVNGKGFETINVSEDAFPVTIGRVTNAKGPKIFGRMAVREEICL